MVTPKLIFSDAGYVYTSKSDSTIEKNLICVLDMVSEGGKTNRTFGSGNEHNIYQLSSMLSNIH